MTVNEQTVLLSALDLYIQDALNEVDIQIAKRLYQRICEEEVENEC